MTYNILDGGENRLESIAQIVTDENPDILSINEANEFHLNDNEKLKSLGAMTGMPFYHLACSEQSEYHVATYSKKPFLSAYDIRPLSRAGVRVTVNSSIGEIAIVGTHLSYFSEEERLREISTIFEALKNYDHKVIMGDLNSLAEIDNYDQDRLLPSFTASQIRKFTDSKQLLFDVVKRIENQGFHDAARTARSENVNTVPTGSNIDSSHSSFRLDYVFMSENLNERMADYRVVKNEMTELASDHYPVVVDLAL